MCTVFSVFPRYFHVGLLLCQFAILAGCTIGRRSFFILKTLLHFYVGPICSTFVPRSFNARNLQCLFSNLANPNARCLLCMFMFTAVASWVGGRVFFPQLQTILLYVGLVIDCSGCFLVRRLRCLFVSSLCVIPRRVFLQLLIELEK